MRILFIGDIVGKGGRKAAMKYVPELKESENCDFCIANAENMAGGSGFTKKCVDSLVRSGVDVLTGGDHMWDQRAFVTEIEDLPMVLRPQNVNPDQPGKGFGIFTLKNSTQNIAVVLVLGRTFMKVEADCPFRAVDQVLEEIKDQTKHVIVDFHAEATSEKIAMGRYLDGRVGAVLGTHTHVPTADSRIFPGGTAFQCDVGMAGARESILGRAIEPVVSRFTSGMPARFTVVETGIRMHATIVELDDETGQAVSIEPIYRDLDD